MTEQTSAQKAGRYVRLPAACCISYVAITECLSKLGAAEVYHVCCGKHAFLDLKTLMQLEWQNKSPFHPVVNYTWDDMLAHQEWYITALKNGKYTAGAVGSEGL